MIMDKVELYRQVYSAFKRMCAEGNQPSSFNAYCKKHGVDQCRMPLVLKDEFQPVTTLPGYVIDRGMALVCSRIFNDFKILCAEAKQPGSFASYCKSRGVTWNQMHDYLSQNKLRVSDLPGYSGPTGVSHSCCREIPFEDVIFEEAGFLPCNEENVITVRIDGHVAVSFPADTDVNVIAKFVSKTRKETGHVGN